MDSIIADLNHRPVSDTFQNDEFEAQPAQSQHTPGIEHS